MRIGIILNILIILFTVQSWAAEEKATYEGVQRGAVGEYEIEGNK